MPKKKSRAPVKVVAAPSSSFPDFSSFTSFSRGRATSESNPKRKKREQEQEENSSKIKGIEIDFDETVQEIRELGSSQFTGKQKRKYQDEQYKSLTGREKKKQKVPLNIVRGIREKARQREKRAEQENKDAGIVTHTNSRKKTNKGFSEKNRKDSRIHGPAPTIGFTKKG
eukprot:332824_1